MEPGATSVDRYDRAVLAPYQQVMVSWATGAHRVLEFGPSTGYMSQAMRDTGCHVTAVEVDRAALEVLAGRADSAHWGDLDRPDTLAFLPDGHFDVIVLADVLEHLRGPAEALRVARRLLAPDGRILVSMPNIAYWRIRSDLMRGRWTMTKTGILDETHLRFFTRESAEQMFRDCDLVVRDTDDVFWEFPFDNRVRRHFSALWPLRNQAMSLATRRYPALFASQYLWVLESRG